MNAIKGQIIATEGFNKKFHAEKIGSLKNEEVTLRFVRDTTIDDEYFLEICAKSSMIGKAKPKRIPLTSIDSIEIDRDQRFSVTFVEGGKWLKTRSTKVETFQSSYMKEIMDCYDYACQNIVDKEEELNQYIERTYSMEGVTNDTDK